MELQTTEYDTIRTGVYKDKHQAIVGYYPKGSSEFKPRTNKVTKKGGGEVFVPVSITIGDTDTATKFLLGWLLEITGQEYTAVPF